MIELPDHLLNPEAPHALDVTGRTARRPARRPEPTLYVFPKRTYWVWGLSMLGASILWTAVGALFWPAHLETLWAGIILGFGFLVTLMGNAHFPLGKFQIVFSLTRMLLFAYLIVYAGQFNVSEIGVVFCGFLSYKMVLLMDIVFQCVIPTQKSSTP